jgi:hypothetical protein
MFYEDTWRVTQRPFKMAKKYIHHGRGTTSTLALCAEHFEQLLVLRLDLSIGIP